MTDAGAGERFHCPRTHTPYTDDGDAGIKKAFQRGLPVEPGNAAEADEGV